MNEHKTPVWPEGLKKTKQRIEIIKALYEAEKPLSAQEICAELMSRGNTMWLSTVYRVLETLMNHGLIQKSAEHESGTALYEIGDKHRHYAVCVSCKRIIELEGCPVEGFLLELQDKKFHVVGHKLQISGVCGDCHA